MKKRVVSIIIFLFVVSMIVLWFIPVHFLCEVEPVEVVAIKVLNGNSGNEFEITNFEDIATIVNNIKEIAFKKYGVSFNIDYGYYLAFIDANGEEIASLGVQNSRMIRKDITQKCAAFYSCDGELGIVTDYLKSLEALQFPDYDKDPSFPDS